MQYSGVSLAVSPLATGHPLGLPDVPARTSVETRVQPVSRQAKAGTDTANDRHPPAPFWRVLTDEADLKNHTAPPSIMQIKISAMLDEQAARLQESVAQALPQEAPEPPQETAPLPGSATAEDETAPDPAQAEPQSPNGTAPRDERVDSEPPD